MGSNTNLCRLCMSSVDVRVNLFQCPVVTESYSQQISCMFQIELDLKKQWSTLACRSCVLVLDETRELRKKVLATQEALLLLESSDVKPEVPVDVKRWEWEEDEDRDYDFAAEPGPSSPKNATKDEVESEDDIKPIPKDTEDILEKCIENVDDEKPLSKRVIRRSRRQKTIKTEPAKKVKEQSSDESSEEEEKEVKIRVPQKKSRVPKEWAFYSDDGRDSEEEVVSVDSDSSHGNDKNFKPDKDEEEEDETTGTPKVTRRTAQSLNITLPEVSGLSHDVVLKEARQLSGRKRPRKGKKIHSGSEEDNVDWSHVKTEKPKRSLKELREERAPLDKMMLEMGLLHCAACGLKAETFSELNSHSKKEHKKNASIFCCEKKLPPSQAHDHMRYHMDKDLFKCTICQKVHISGLTLNKHMYANHSNPEDLHQCDVCGKGLTLARLKSHLLTHIAEEDRQFKCNECPRAFYKKYMLECHVRSQHQKDQTHFVCDICGKGGYSTERLLLEHQKRHEERKSEKCEECGLFFFNVKNHKKRVHREKERFPCKVCGVVMYKQTLQRHMRDFHIKPVLIQCPHCPKEFRQKLTFNTHMNIHRGIKFKCNFCPVETSDPGNRYKHMNQAHPIEYGAYKAQKNAEAKIKKGM